jgi:general secretion pathway protein B
MSFILDALKKSESERNRQSGPVLMDVRIAPPRRHLPIWAWVIGMVLLANLAILGYLLLHKQPPRDQLDAATTSAATAPVAAQPASAVLPPPTLPAPQITATIAASPQSVPVMPAAAPATTTPADDITPSDAALPTAQDLLATGVTLPQLRLDLHVYDAAPGNRYILLNSKRLREGDFTADGIKVERITPRGAVLEVQGRRFMLSAGG